MSIAADRPEKITEPRLRMDPISAERYTSKERRVQQFHEVLNDYMSMSR
jgi:hypothetical protein